MYVFSGCHLPNFMHCNYFLVFACHLNVNYFLTTEFLKVLHSPTSTKGAIIMPLSDISDTSSSSTSTQPTVPQHRSDDSLLRAGLNPVVSNAEIFQPMQSL